MKKARRLAGAALLALAAVTVVPAPAEASWRPKPEPATYGQSEAVPASVTMDDGVVLSARVVYPVDPVTGARAPGPFPVLLSQTPYGMAGPDPRAGGAYFVERGYIYVTASVRGTGTSGGQLDWFGRRQGQDGATLVNWAAHALPGSDGAVGLDGCSYLGVDQWYTAAEVGPHSALKAIAPFCTDSQMYQDLATVGGVPTTFIPSISRAFPRGPEDDPLTDPLSVTAGDLTTGGARSYDNAYWHGIDVQEFMPRIVANGVPALSEAGWKDLFPGGNIGAYVAAQNAYFGRPVTAPIAAGERVTGRYQAIVGPWTHGQHVNEDVLSNLRKEWFDTWLKGRPTGMANTAKPLHLFENGGDRWVDTAAWPPSTGTGTYYLGGNGTLTTTRPATEGSDALSAAPTYTTAPLTRDAVLDGPIDVSVQLKSTAPDAYVAVTVNLVSPSGAVTKVSDGGLLASLRELDTRRSWYGAGHTLIQPSHPFTQASRRLLTPGETVRLDIAVLPNLTVLPAGSRLQVVLTAQAPAGFHLQPAPTPQQSANLAAGRSAVSRAPWAPSSVTVPLAAPHSFTTSPITWGPAS
ncbi:CocE/NonD family hydrolase [Amycolatopsis sp., V23-08]|uniref:CocE/NonD family hydrolase n=1 Tax=Amycolatopsis heterodermiae TaxID=3110235 RepID=A0ABU5RLQ3_9PSEU|nr:CocE/NonD family hydrolase [Amycolatopsis sp., V23-08]MEA5366740.1 CocE/NonD family hydrolase [Amycolatopsis sp., V23-08]